MDEKAVLERVFGQSSSESESEDDEDRFDWEEIREVKGLWISRNFLSPYKQSTLFSEVQSENWFTQPSNNQAMRFGDLPSWAIQLSHSVRDSVLAASDDDRLLPLPLDLLLRQPLFDQMIVNQYQPGEGICAHVDLLRFEDGIAIVSLESSCVMHFSSVDNELVSVPVLLNPGSLVVMSGEARYRWKHEINRKPGFQTWEGRELDQMRRTSVTLRKLCE
ncbi:hypothetical protein Lal_00021562 [Lupinus albus]|uniref:Putative tRNA (Carboxymethyluridine(34)-5-O)-methyltransferase n=1 Tax=Lupinus albus TaxID=3870 RepID=A0A6A5LID2_LUPAL|nr:putative tRNA (carboxymethyluridine(34)-5-O)-methyltransferase [Lupinus albus]KAF1860519.1 hypothetical protein Lal_00021562 [Lupinus albus]